MFFGKDVLEIGESRLGQKYVFGATAPLDNPNWNGPWDCAEYASWCVYQAYGLIFGAGRVTKPSKAEPYSGYWYDEATRRGTSIAWQDALRIPGAVLVRRPASGKIGHVAFSMGDNARTLEARGAKFGVNIFDSARDRAWTIGCLLPGVNYDGQPDGLDRRQLQRATQSVSFPVGYLWLRKPNIKAPEVASLQRALQGKKIDPGPIDGEFGPQTHAAVVAFQLVEGIEVDGIVGPSTSKALGLAFPIAATDRDKAMRDAMSSPAPSDRISLSQETSGSDSIVGMQKIGNGWRAETRSGSKFSIGSSTRFTDDANRVGLMQRRAEIADSLQFGVYSAADFKAVFGLWAHFIEPTLNAEGGARFATLNTYDRAAFTFGAPQLAAHTPGENFVEYFREVLKLDAGKAQFPELSVRKNGKGQESIYLVGPTGERDLEEVVVVTRPNGKTERQLAHLMTYLNPSPTVVDVAELSAAARLMLLLRLDSRTRELQVQVFIRGIERKVAAAKRNVAGFTGKEWRIALWIVDILHHGRGSYREMSNALSRSEPEAALMQIGLSRYRGRIESVADAVRTLASSRVLEGFEV